MMDIYNYLTASADGCVCSHHSVRFFHVPFVKYNSIHSISKLYVQPTSFHVYICSVCLLECMETYDDNVNIWAGVRQQQKSMGVHIVVVGEVEGEGGWRGGGVCMTGLSPLLSAVILQTNEV